MIIISLNDCLVNVATKEQSCEWLANGTVTLVYVWSKHFWPTLQRNFRRKSQVLPFLESSLFLEGQESEIPHIKIVFSATIHHPMSEL